jgi:hypothetical protein
MLTLFFNSFHFLVPSLSCKGGHQRDSLGINVHCGICTSQCDLSKITPSFHHPSQFPSFHYADNVGNFPRQQTAFASSLLYDGYLKHHFFDNFSHRITTRQFSKLNCES